MPAAPEPSPFFNAAGDPILADCAVLFVDILGVRAMSTDKSAPEYLVRLDRAVRRGVRDFLDPKSPWPAHFFSDTLVLVAPVSLHGGEEAAINGLVDQAAWLQTNLIADGFFLRGALTVGKLHSSSLLFGSALVEAYDLESKQAVHPRIVLSERATEILREATGGYPEASQAPQNTSLLRDDDGFTFIDYLALLLVDIDDPRQQLELHRDIIVTRLTEHRTKRRQWEKYRWVAEYHNAVCSSAFAGEEHLLVPASDATWRFESFVGD